MSAPEPPSQRRVLVVAVVAVAVTVLAALAGLLIGYSDIPWGDILGNALAHVGIGHSVLDQTQNAIIWQLRAPRVVMALVVGAMLAVAGGSYQGVFRNPLADPYLLGVAAGAGLGATIAIVDLGGVSGSVPVYTPWLAFAGAMAAVALTWVAGGRGLRSNTATLILAGVAMAALLSSAQTFLQQSSTNSIRTVYFWLLGTLSQASWSEIGLVAPYVAVCCAVCIASGRILDLMSVGDVESRALGLPVSRARLVIVLFSSLGTAAVVSVVGIIGFVGIVIPHVVRLAVGTSYRRILPISVAVGAAFLVICDTIARTVLHGGELPIGVVTAAIGAPVFVIILNVSHRSTS